VSSGSAAAAAGGLFVAANGVISGGKGQLFPPPKFQFVGNFLSLKIFLNTKFGTGNLLFWENLEA